MAPRPAQAGRKEGNQKFYNSTPWRKLRALKISLQPTCEECLQNGIVKDATGRNGVIDHITPINEGGAPLAIENLRTLCNACHNSKSGKERHKQ